MNYKLGDIAKIQFGLYEKNKVQGEVKYLLAQHFDEAGRLTDFKDSYINSTVDNKRFLLQDNDVLLTGKGFKKFAWLYKKEIGQAIASSLFFIIKPNTKIILPQYLVLSLNSIKMKHYFKILGEASTIPSIPKKELMQLKIKVPSIEKQQKIVRMATLIDKDIQLSKEIVAQKIALKKAVLEKMITDT